MQADGVKAGFLGLTDSMDKPSYLQFEKLFLVCDHHGIRKLMLRQDSLHVGEFFFFNQLILVKAVYAQSILIVR